MKPQACSESLSYKKPDIFISSDQDGLFFGLELVQNFINNKNSSSKIVSYFRDGDFIFKNQTLMRVSLIDQNIKKNDLLSLMSYFSGVYTLVSCWTERNFNFSIMAYPTSGFSFFEWEKRAILKAGALIGKNPKTIYFHPKEVNQTLKKGEKEITISNLEMSNEQIQNLLKTIPDFVKCSLQGSFLPSDLEPFQSFNLTSVYPLCLQGFFPQLKMKIDM